MTLTVTPIYAIPLTALFLVLSWRVIAERRGNRFAYGNNESPRIEAKIRAQGNWAEYAPITLLLMLMAELQGIGALWLHLTGLLLLTGRVMHGYGMSFRPKIFALRRWGMILTFAAIAVALVLNLAVLG